MVHVHKGPLAGPFLLDGRTVPIITAYLFHAGGHDDPAQLRANAGKSFQGSIVLGMGFTFDDTDTKGVAIAVAEMHRTDRQGPAERRADLSLHRRRGGQRFADACPSSVRHQLREMSLEEAEQWPDLIRIVRRKSQAERDRLEETLDRGRTERSGGGSSERSAPAVIRRDCGIWSECL